jgi:plasmid replication initiation protein
MAATPYEILSFIGRGTGANDYQGLTVVCRGHGDARWGHT